MSMKIKTVGLLACLVLAASCTGSKAIKLYQDNLGSMVDQDEQNVRNQIMKTWQFELLDQWTAESPSPDTVKKKEYQQHTFSKNELKTVFAPSGQYSVQVYIKPLGERQGQMGKIDGMGQSLPESRRTMSNVDYGLIRIVFRDKKLVHFSVWKRSGPNPRESKTEYRDIR